MNTNDIAIQVESLRFRYGESSVLEDVNWTVPTGAFTAILGPNGSGKSTLLKLLLGLLRPLSGRLSLFGVPAGRLAPGRIGYVPQVKTLDRTFPARAVELVATGLRKSWPGLLSAKERDLCHAALEQVNAGHIAGRQLGGLSGGELQRVYLARSFVRTPDLIILDEPATGIDVVGERDMYRILEEYQKQRKATVLMVTHDLDAARHHASHVMLLNRRVVGYGEPSQVLTDHCLREAYGHMGHSHSMVNCDGEAEE